MTKKIITVFLLTMSILTNLRHEKAASRERSMYIDI